MEAASAPSSSAAVTSPPLQPEDSLAASEGSAPAHILVVDDRENMVLLLQKVLRADGVVHTARSGAEALASLEAHPISVVVCDLRIPDMSGIDVLRASKRRAPHTEFILMTAYASVPTAIEAMRDGAYDYITKPFDPENLRAVVAAALGRWAGIKGVLAATSGSDPVLGLLERAADVELARPELISGSAPDLATSLVSMKWQEAIDFCRREGGRRYLQAVLELCGGRVAEAAAHAGIERESFYRLLRKHGVQPNGRE